MQRGGGGLRAAAPPSQAPAPVEPARAGPPPTTRDDLGGPGYKMARVLAADGGRAIYEGGRNDVGSPAATVGDGRGDHRADVRHGSSMQGPGRSHVGGSRWPLVREQLAARLTRDGAAAIGQMVVRGMADDPGLRQLLLGGMAREVDHGSEQLPRRVAPRD